MKKVARVYMRADEAKAETVESRSNIIIIIIIIIIELLILSQL